MSSPFVVGLSRLVLDSTAVFIDGSNVDAVAPLMGVNLLFLVRGARTCRHVGAGWGWVRCAHTSTAAVVLVLPSAARTLPDLGDTPWGTCTARPAAAQVHAEELPVAVVLCSHGVGCTGERVCEVAVVWRRGGLP